MGKKRYSAIRDDNSARMSINQEDVY
jgi:hypothetical protein